METEEKPVEHKLENFMVWIPPVHALLQGLNRTRHCRIDGNYRIGDDDNQAAGLHPAANESAQGE